MNKVLYGFLYRPILNDFSYITRAIKIFITGIYESKGINTEKNFIVSLPTVLKSFDHIGLILLNLL